MTERWVEHWIDDGAGNSASVWVLEDDGLGDWPQEEAACADEAQAA